MSDATHQTWSAKNTLSKAERLSRKRLIDKLFTGSSKSVSSFPLRLVYLEVEPTETPAPASVLVSVSKRKFKRAVHRNRIKRQIREAYRKNKAPLYDSLQQHNKSVLLALIYVSDKIIPTDCIEQKVQTLMARLIEKTS